MSGFSYPQPTFISAIYNPGFYLSLDANGYLTYDYAKTIFLDRNDYRLSYLSGITAGIGSAGTALVLNSTGSITSGITSLTMTNLILGTATIGSTEAGYLSGLTAGTAANSKALVLSNTGSITGITSLTTGTINASTYQQDGTTYSLASFLTAVPSSFTSSGTITAGTVNATTYRQSGTTYNLASFLTAVPSSFTSSGTITAGTVNATTYQQGGTTYNLANMLTTSTSSISLGGTLSANTVSCTNLTQNGVSYNLASFLTSIPSSLSLSSLTVLGTGAQFNTSAGNTDSIYLPVGSYAMYLRNNSNIISTSVGLAFLNDSSGAYSTTTPSATISTLRRSSTQYDGSDIEFYTKGSASQTGALYRLASLHGTTGQLSIGSNNGYMDLNILKDNAGASIRIGSYQSTANCFTITYSYVGSSYAQNRLQFDNYGFSGQQCWFGDNSVAINSQDVPPAKFAVKGDTTKMYGSWDRVQRWSNDQSTQMAVEMLVYNESGGSNNSSGGGTCLGTMTNDPFKIMTNGSARALFNTSGRFMVGGNFSAEATIHSGGASWANEEFYTKINASSICSYRANWSSANYWGWGSDGTVGSIRAGICNASGSWLGYVPIRGGAYTNASDERLKTDIANVPYGLDAVMLMKPRKYKMIQEGTQHVGFIAQELYDIVPEAVQEGANDDMNENGYPINPWGIDLASLTSVLCKSIQDQQAQIEELKRIVSTLI